VAKKHFSDFSLIHRSAIGQKKASSRLLTITEETCNRDREKSSSLTYLFNIVKKRTPWTEPRRSSPGQAELIAQFFLKFNKDT
jgi:hypothetical protein